MYMEKLIIFDKHPFGGPEGLIDQQRKECKAEICGSGV